MPLSEYNATALLLDIHQRIHDYSTAASEEIFSAVSPELVYPPNTSLTAAEQAALALLSGNEALKTALQKIIADNAGSVVFSITNHIDGTTDPEGEWTGIRLTDYSENEENNIMLHDKLFETYWDWKESR